MSSTGMPSVMQTISAHLGVDRLEDGVGGEGRRHVDQRGVGAGLLHGLGDGVEHRQAQVRRAALARA